MKLETIHQKSWQFEDSFRSLVSMVTDQMVLTAQCNQIPFGPQQKKMTTIKVNEDGRKNGKDTNVPDGQQKHTHTRTHQVIIG